MASHSPTHKSKEEKEKRKSAAKAKIRAIGMVQAAFKRAQQRQGTESVSYTHLTLPTILRV